MSLADERHHVLGPRLIDDALDQAGLADARLSLHDEHGRSATSESTELGHCQGDLVFLEDITGKGHVTRVLSPVTNLFIHVPQDWDMLAWARGRGGA